MTWRRTLNCGCAILVFLIWLITVQTVYAAPAAPVEVDLTQPDGSAFSARLWGDEWQNGYETISGHTILQESDGWWVYATAAKDGSLSSKALNGEDRLVVGNDSPEEIPLGLRPSGGSKLDYTEMGEYTPNLGSQPVLVLLASFSNRAGTYSPASFASSMFGASNSVRDFYLDASFNKLALNPATESYGAANDGVIGWLNLGYAHPNTGGSTGSANQNIVKNALTMADPYINYASFDSNGNGYISNSELHLIVVVAGYEASYGSSIPSVWGHRWNLDNVGAAFLDGKYLGQSPSGGYAQFGEMHGTHQATIGIMAHELGHDLTWPDLYDIDDSSEGVGKWSIMGSGSWNSTLGGYSGNSPALPDAWLKWYQNWISPVAITNTQNGTGIPQAETSSTAFLLAPNPGGVDWNFRVKSGSGEFFLVENRQLTGYDAGLPGCGLVILHIDESVTYTNSANANETRPLVKVMEADGLNQLRNNVNRGDTGDPFPGSSNNTAFTSNTNPNSKFYNGTDSLVAVTGISTCAPTMTANLSYADSYKMLLTLFLVKSNFTPPVNPIRNGTFEAGHDGSWIENSTGGFPIIWSAQQGGFAPHNGSWGAWFGGANYETSRLQQSGIQVGGARYLHYWYWIASEDVCGYDYSRIYVNGVLVSTRNLCDSADTNGWVHAALDLNSYLNTTISLEFRVTTDGSLNSNFFLDDVSMNNSSAPTLTEEWFELTGAEEDPK